MSIKDKIAIVLTILVVVVFGLVLKNIAVDINDATIYGLMEEAKGNPDQFFNRDISGWVGKTINVGNGDAAYDYIDYKSGMCMYEGWKTVGGSEFQVTDIYDYAFDGNGITLSHTGKTNNDNSTNAWTAKLLKSFNDVYNSGNDWISYTDPVKENVKSVFAKASQNGGIAVSEGFINQTEDWNYILNLQYQGDETYGQQVSNYKEVTSNSEQTGITLQHESTSGEGYTMIGPFNINYSGIGIENIKIESSVKSFEGADNGGIYYSTAYKTIDGIAEKIANGDPGWSNILSNIPAGIEFYIAVSDSGEEFNKGNDLKITINQKGIDYYKTRLMLFAQIRGGGQPSALFAVSPNKYTGTVTLNVNPTAPTNLTVTKQGKNVGTQAGVQFRLSNGQTENPQVTYTNMTNVDGVNVYSGITYTNWVNDDDPNCKQLFTTGTSGKFRIEGLDPSYTYSVLETMNPIDGYGGHQIGVIDICQATMPSDTSGVLISNSDPNNNTNKNQVTGVNLNASQSNELTIIDQPSDVPDKFNIHIEKYSEGSLNSGVMISGAQFKVQVLNISGSTVGWLKQTDNKTSYTYDYHATYDESSVWTSQNGTSISINGLACEYSYKIYETKVATGYNYSSQKGYARAAVGKSTTTSYSVIPDKNYSDNTQRILCAETSYSKHGTSAYVRVTNYKYTGDDGGPDGTRLPDYLNIKGKIWIDKLNNAKPAVYDDVYNSENEELYKGKVTVSLYDASGNKLTNTETQTGEYDLRTSIQIYPTDSAETAMKRLSNYYIKFEYDKKYMPVFPVVDKNHEKFKDANVSRAIEEEGSEGTADIYNLADYVEQYQAPTLNNMNMGLKERDNGNKWSISEDISYVKVIINGYTYTYLYGLSGEEDENVPTVQWEKDLGYYSREIYPSDIASSIGNWQEESSLKVYVVYSIKIKNEETRNYGITKEYAKEHQTQYSYVAVDMRASNLVNEFDTERYELATEVEESTKRDEQVKRDFADWKMDPQNSGRAIYTGERLDRNIKPEDSDAVTVYIQFKVKDSALEQLLNKDSSFEKKPTKASASAVHNYWSSQFVWKRTSEGWQKEFKISDHTTDPSNHDDESYYLRLILAEEREIQGVVFEDKDVNENDQDDPEVLGDSRYTETGEEAENTIQNVTVKLINADGPDKGKVATIYNKEDYGGKDGGKYKGEEASIMTSEKGKYSFKGVVPGKYYVQFTYGDGTTIIAPNGDKLGEASIDDYKATILTETCVMAANKYEFETPVKIDEEEWYKHKLAGEDREDRTIWSTAMDVTSQRNDYYYTNKDRKTMDAKTAVMSVTIENSKNNEFQITKADFAKKENIKNNAVEKSTTSFGTKETIKGINFGIIKLPKKAFAFDKVASYIEIINEQGNVIAKGNPKIDTIPTVSNLDESKQLTDGSKYVRAEVNEDELYGSTLRITYDISVQNNSQVEYYYKNDKYKEYYYKYGDSDRKGADEASLTVDEILDYLDPSLTYVEGTVIGGYNMDVVDVSTYQKYVDRIKNGYKNIEGQDIEGTELSYSKILKMSNEDKETGNDETKVYSTLSLLYRGDKTKTQDLVQFTATRELSSDDDFNVSNKAEVISIHISYKPELIEPPKLIPPYPDKPDPDYPDPDLPNPSGIVDVTVIPPTGEDKVSPIIYIVTGIVSLAIISTGIVLIKKKVLHK